MDENGVEKGHEAVTQGNTICVQPEKFDSVTSFSEYTPFEEVYHTALGPREGNVQEGFADTQGKKMFEAYRSRQKRERWGR